MGLEDYPKIIEKPMDLGTIRKNINNKEYKTIEEGLSDLRLVW